MTQETKAVINEVDAHVVQMEQDAERYQETINLLRTEHETKRLQIGAGREAAVEAEKKKVMATELRVVDRTQEQEVEQHRNRV